jgi:hypothetical protein
MKKLLILIAISLVLAAFGAVLSVHPIVVAWELHLSRNGCSADQQTDESVLRRVGGQVIQFLNRRSL